MSARQSQHPVAALVTGVHLRSVLAGVRGLGRAGIQVVALAPTWRAAGLRSRHVCATNVGPDPDGDPSAFAARVADLCAQRDPVVVYPGDEAAIDALTHGPAAVGSFRLASGSVAALDAVRDKQRLSTLAADAGLFTPATLATGTAQELRSVRLPTPCVFKPVRSGASSGTAVVLSSPSDVATFLERQPPGAPLIVQERVRGPLRALALVVDAEGRVAARFEQVARRTFPADAGISSEAVSVAPNEALTARAAYMLWRAGFWGLAQLQFVESAEGLRLIDVNPRFYGSLPLALAAGVNLPAAWHSVATGDSAAQPEEYMPGVTYRWLESDVVAGAKGDLRRLFRRVPSPRVGAVWASDDPLPACIHALQATRRRVRNGVRQMLERRRASACPS